MLKNIPSIIPPELLKILMEMGHGDEIVIGDGNFPAAANAKNLVRCDGHNVPDVLDAILQLMPLDPYVDCPVSIMQTVGNDPTPTIWATYHKIVEKFEPINNKFEQVERFAFYDRAKNAYAIVATGESAVYANIILKKGVVK